MRAMNKKHDAIKQACEALGGVTALANAIGVRAPTVSQWISGSRPIPEKRCPQIERVTEGRVRCEDLRPDVEWSVLRNTPSSRPVAPA